MKHAMECSEIDVFTTSDTKTEKAASVAFHLDYYK